MKKLLLFVTVVLLTASLASASEVIVNGGFETGDFTGWSTNVETGSDGGLFVSGTTSSPISGKPNAGPAGGTYFALTSQGGPGSYSLVQVFNLAPEQQVTLSFDLFANDWGEGVYTGALDKNQEVIEFATVDLLSGGANPFDTGAGVIQNFYLGADNPDGNPNPWTHYSFDISSLVAAGGTYQIRFGEADNFGFFNLGVDNVSVMAGAAGVPEPTTLLLMCSALGGLFLLRRKA